MSLGLLLRARLRQGWGRVRRAAVPLLLAAIAAGGAYAVARYGLGHQYPFFAPVAAWLALGFSADRDLRRVAELAIGVAVGVLAGDLLVHAIGSGAWQVAVVLAIAVLVARMLDRGDLLAIQAGVQAVVVVVLPASATGGPVGRWVDAMVGGAVALVVAALSPQDPRRRVRAVAEEAMAEVADLLRVLSEGLRAGDRAAAHRALLRGRASQPVLDTWRSAAVSARQTARLSPAFRRHRDELGEMVAAATAADRAMRNARVLARRSEVVLERPELHGGTGALADMVDLGRVAAQEIGAALAAGGSPVAARAAVARAADQADPARTPADLHVQQLVLLLRSLLVDLAETAGMDPTEARTLLPEI
ncbi:FUSC family protein [Actinotalea sp. M2MS4P-6]|uniref:FUSC family protein n=1 Tax=Actinotalea sp. M2MS4P-6 TaxID=2983762 RepID=UPI0021E3A33B|nr:FUSC family protein [Actinotalea sp. M2MS4P-6]MCV2393192.1 FUSC family protein [Actinotalea sp. M2MS4P-6]